MHLLAAAAAGLCQVLSLIPLHFGLLSPAANARECCFDTCLPDAAKQDFVLGNANTACVTPETEIVSAEVDSCKLGSFTGWRKQVLKNHYAGQGVHQCAGLPTFTSWKHLTL